MLFKPDRSLSSPDPLYLGPNLYERTHRNPLRAVRLSTDLYRQNEGCGSMRYYFGIKFDFVLKKIDIESSYRDMYITDPPAKIITVCWVRLYCSPNDIQELAFETVVRDKNGVQFWRIIDAWVDLYLVGQRVDLKNSWIEIDPGLVVSEDRGERWRLLAFGSVPNMCGGDQRV